MSRRLIGTLTDPSGTPLAGWLLTLDARRNAAPSVPIGASESVVLDVSGGYDLVITDGLYMALLTAPGGTIQRRIGLFLVAPGADIDILTLIELYSSATGFALAIEDEGVQIVAAATLINFTGAGVVASALGNAVTVAIDGGGGGGGGVTDAEYIVAATHAGLSAERVLTAVADETSIDTATAGQIKVGLTPHLAAPDPHPVYALDTDLSAYLPKALVDVKGDLLVATAADTVARKGAGANGTFLKADSAQADGLQWAALTDTDIPSTIARDTEVTAAVAAHEVDTTAVHGIADTAALIGAPYVTTAASAALSGEKVLGTDVIMRGTFAARPAAATSGLLYLATDVNGGTLYRDTGTVWEQTGQGVTEAGSASGAAAGVLSGTYPNPDFAVDMATQAELAAHVVAADPHTVYQLEAQKGAINGYASLDAGGTVPDAQIPAGIARVIVGQAFSTFPAPSAGIAGLVLRANDAVFPAPGIDLVCDGTRWRPVNGSAVLAMRVINPITVQNTSVETAETIGPFPGGLIRSGQRLELESNYSFHGLGTGNRQVYLNINGSSFFIATHNTNSLSNYGRTKAKIDVLSDSSIVHDGSFNLAISYNAAVASKTNPTADFSAPWTAEIAMRSAAETAKTITGATWVGGVATYTCTGHTLATGDKTTVAAVTPSGYNGVHIVTVIDANTFTAPIASDPGTYTSGGTSSRISNVVSESYVLEWKG